MIGKNGQMSIPRKIWNLRQWWFVSDSSLGIRKEEMDNKMLKGEDFQMEISPYVIFTLWKYLPNKFQTCTNRKNAKSELWGDESTPNLQHLAEHFLKTSDLIWSSDETESPREMKLLIQGHY